MAGRDSDSWPVQWVAAGGARVHVRRVSRAEALAGIPAPAKVNFGLAVTGRRTDGYHKLVTLMAPLSLADTVRVEPASSFSLVCDDPTLATDDNLVLRAARGLQSLTGERRAARITLTKRIPVSAGLGGGSGDAAATLIALDAVWGTRTPDDALLALARGLGADVPFALYGGAMVARGIGDVLRPHRCRRRGWCSSFRLSPSRARRRRSTARSAPYDFGDGARSCARWRGCERRTARSRRYSTIPSLRRSNGLRPPSPPRAPRSKRETLLPSFPAVGRRSRCHMPAKPRRVARGRSASLAGCDGDRHAHTDMRAKQAMERFRRRVEEIIQPAVIMAGPVPVCFEATERLTRVKRFIDGMRERPYNRGVRCGGGAGSVPHARMPLGRVPFGQHRGRCGLFRAVLTPFEEP